jgi:hypothetical protein
MSPVHPFLPGLAEKIAIGAVQNLLKASALGIKRRLSGSEVKKALQAAVAEALTEAMAGQELDEEWSAHYAPLLEEFFSREEAAIELTQLLDPRPNQAPDLATLAREFRMAGFDPDTMPGFDLDSFLHSFLSAFYAAAAMKAPLRTGIDLKVLGAQLEQLGIVVENTRRTADSLDEIKVLLRSFVTGQSELAELRRLVEAALAGGYLPAYRTFEAIGAGLLKEGIDFGVNAAGVLEISSPAPSASRELPPARLEAVRLLAGELRQTVVEHRPNAEELDVLEDRYRQHLVRWFESLTFQGMMRAPKPIVLPLEDVYVELRAVAEVPEAADAFSVEERRLLLESDAEDETERRELMSQLDAFRRERWSRTVPERKSMAEALHQRDRRAFVILGDPGSGKTTLLHFLALVYARGPETAAQRLGVDPDEADRLPIFVPLAAFDDMLRESRRLGESLTLREFLPRYYDRRRGLPGLEPLFRRALESGRALVLLDGLDEVLDIGTRTYVAQQASALIGEWSARGVRFAVSSRFVGYREAPVPGLPTLSVLDFGTPEIETFVRRWAHAFEKWAAQGVESPEMLRKAQTLEAGLMDDVRSNESVRRLAANPLMLTMLALLRRQVGRLPHRRVQLYESYVGTLLENWVDARSEGARESSVEILDRHQAENILIPLAFWLQKEKPSGTAGRAEIRNHLVEICLKDRGIDPATVDRAAKREAEEQAERFLHEMRQMTGLLIERGHDAFGFLHLTFQEYFAGRALAQLGDQGRWEAIRRHLHDPRWREPILLCAGRLGVVENRRPQVTQLVRDILEHEDPVEADLHRNLLLALAVACDDVNLEPVLVNDLVERAMALLTSALARELVRLLGQLIVNGTVRSDLCLARVEESKNYRLKLIAIEEWGRFGEVEEIDAWLKAQLDSYHERIVSAALDALALRIGKDASLWQKAIACLTSSHHAVCGSAVRALAQITPNCPEVRQALMELLEKAWSRGPVLAALTGLAKSDTEVRRAFLQNLDHKGSYVSHGLSMLAGQDTEVREALLRAAADRVSGGSAIDALADLVGEDDEIRRIILEGLDVHSRSAVRALAPILGTDSEALLKVMEILDRERDWVGLLETLKMCGRGIPEIREVFLKGMGASDWQVRRIACEGLGESGSASRDDLMSVLHKRDALEARREIFKWCASLSENISGEEWIDFWLEALSDRNLEYYFPETAMVALRRVDDREFQRKLEGAIGRYYRRPYAGRKPALYGFGRAIEEALRLETLVSVLGDAEEARQAILLKLEDRHFQVRLLVVEVIAKCQNEALFESLCPRLWLWLSLDEDGSTPNPYGSPSEWPRSVQAQLAKRFGSRLPTDSSLYAYLLEMLRAPRWSARLGAVLALLAWPGGPPGDVLTQVFSALEDPRGLEAYPAQLTAASFLINQNDTVAEAIELCLEALDYGTQLWEDIDSSREVRKQAAFVLGKLEPVFYEPRVYDKLLHVLHHDEDADVRDAAYGTLVRLARIRDQQAEG